MNSKLKCRQKLAESSTPLSPKVAALEKYLAANPTGVKMQTYTTGKRLVVTSRAKLRAYVRRFHRTLKGGQS